MKFPGKAAKWDARQETPDAANFAGVFVEKGFSTASRRINNHFAFTAIGTGPSRQKDGEEQQKAGEPKKKRKANSFGFVRLAGRVYHYIPGADDDRSVVPYYVHDTTPSTPEKSDAEWLQRIHQVLMRTHPLAQKLRAARDVDARAVKVVRDPSTPKAQCTTEIAARYRIATDVDEMPDRHFVVFSREGGMQRYPTLCHELYEPLHYPLVHPHGTIGWWAGQGRRMYKDASGNPMTLMWYSRQRLFREWSLAASGRLLNEWLVDSFCRMDDTRLQYIRSPEGQQKLRIAEKCDVEHYCEDIEAGVGTADDKPGRIPSCRPATPGRSARCTCCCRMR